MVMIHLFLLARPVYREPATQLAAGPMAVPSAIDAGEQMQPWPEPRSSIPMNESQRCASLLELSNCHAAQGLAFVHVSKAVGGTIHNTLLNCKKTEKGQRVLQDTSSERNKAMHMTVGEWNDFLAKTHVQANKTFFFASTRNPYERMVSIFYYHFYHAFGKTKANYDDTPEATQEHLACML